ncbi:MAG TPA: hypothetical protein VGH27_17200 [Streptosporangiaceae bacterium]
MNAEEAALWWARIRAAGPQLVSAGTATPPGLIRLAEPGSEKIWLLPFFPYGSGPAVLDELDLPRPVLEHPNDSARVLAACLRCCWPDPAGPLWPGASAPFARVAATFEAITGRGDTVARPALVAALRRLSGSGWLLWDDQARTVRLGPRVATWAPAELSTLRELWRSIPAPGELGLATDEPAGPEEPA